MTPMISASEATSVIASRSAAALNPFRFSTRINLKRGPSSRQRFSIGCQNAGSGVLLMITRHSKFGYSSRATESIVRNSISGGSRYAGIWIDTFGEAASGGGGDIRRSRRGLAPKVNAAGQQRHLSDGCPGEQQNGERQQQSNKDSARRRLPVFGIDQRAGPGKF